MSSPSKIYLSQSSLANNLDFIRQQLGDEVLLSSVVKGNAYGHGIAQFVPMAEQCGIRHFSVFCADEAHQVKEVSSEKSDIMIMGDIANEDLSWAIENGIEFFVFEFDRLIEAADIAKSLGVKAKVHIEVETGLNRTGFDKHSLTELAEVLIKKAEHLSLEGICTHLAGAESIANHVRIKKQLSVFNQTVKWLKKKDIHPKKKHTACSAAAMTYPKTRMDMVRIGILQYGFWPGPETFIHFLGKQKAENKQDPLKRVIKWKSTVMSTKSIARGEFIGYGNSYLAHQDMRVATVPVGYSHGYSRVLSNQGRALINNTRVGVIGLVNMNMMMLDVTEVDVSKGDEVILIGGDNGLEISVASFGELSNQLNYELLTRLPYRIPRIITK
ncbi:alanine racemase [Fulvivirga lutimaris]|nr:alanine racemase [Fulvivirga lutimaris]